MGKFSRAILALGFLLLTCFNSTFAQTAEICGNGLDDDGDGFVDLFDTECIASNSVCTLVGDSSVCRFTPQPSPMVLADLWQSDTLISGHTPLAVGDLNGDCIPEIVARYMTTSMNPPAFTNPNNGGRIVIIDGATGQEKWTSAFTPIAFVNNGFLIADSDNDSRGEIYYITPDNLPNANGFGPRRLVCFEFNGSNGFVLRWVSNTQVGPAGNVKGAYYSVDIADFDMNGTAEVYAGNQIYNSATGVELINGGLLNSVGYRALASSHPGGFPVAADVLSSTDVLPGTSSPCGGPCDGLELLAGNTVYIINNSFTSMTRVLVNSTVGDGATSVADMDLDGRLDVVATNYNTANNTPEVYVWNPRTAALIGNRITIPIGPATPVNTIGRVCIADFDNDQKPEMGIVTRNHITVLNDFSAGFQILWDKDVADASGMTGTTVFDFDGDGTSEVVYRDEQNLYVMNGANGAVKASRPCLSATASESPVVVDVDADGRTDILCACDDVSTYNGHLFAFKSGNTPWVSSRTVWNQQAYFTVNVNDNMTVPRTQQGHHLAWSPNRRPLNMFLAQAPLLDNDGYPRNPSADAAIHLISTECMGNTMSTTFEICNYGSAILPAGTVYTLYSGSPSWVVPPAQIITHALAAPLAPGACVQSTVTFTSTSSLVFGAVNHLPGAVYPLLFPNPAIPDCDGGNNIDSMAVQCVWTCDSLNLSAAFTSSVSGGTVTLQDQSTGALMSYVTWDFGDGTSAVGAPGATMQHTYSQGGTYQVCMSINTILPNGSCCHSDSCMTVFIDPCYLHQAAFSFRRANSPQRTYIFTDMSTSGAAVSMWNFGDGGTAISAGAGTSVTHTYAAAGTYNVQLISTLHIDDTTCCIDTVVKAVRVRNGFGDIFIFPTLTNAKVSIEHDFEADAVVTLMIVSPGGEVMHTREVVGKGVFELDVTEYPFGTYTVIPKGREMEGTARFVKH